METRRIPLSGIQGPRSIVFRGRPEGAKVRAQLNLDELDRDKQSTVIFVIPKDTTFFSPAFYLGLLFPSYERLGSESVQLKYKFEFEIESLRAKQTLKSSVDYGHRFAVNSLYAHKMLAKEHRNVIA